MLAAQHCPDVATSRDWTRLLDEAPAIVHSPSASQAKILERLNALRERLATERFQLAVLGQFKRGKSTVLNALLGQSVLPIGVVAVTAIPTAGPDCWSRNFDYQCRRSTEGLAYSP